MFWQKSGSTLLMIALIWVAPVNAQEEEEEEVKERTRTCVGTRRIRSTHVVDDRNVLFYLSGTSVLHNELVDTCRGLKELDNFSYTTTDGQLCKGDGIAPMDDPWGTLRPVPRCFLGIHRQITRDQAKIMMGMGKDMPEVKPLELPMPEPSEVGIEADGNASDAAPPDNGR